MSAHSLRPLAGIGALYLFLSLLNFAVVEEDAFIYFRLAENLAAGHGYVFNPGGPRIEAGSSLLWLFLLVALQGLPGPLVLAAKLAGYALGLLNLWLVHRIARLQITSRGLALLPSLACAVSTPFVMHHQRGLETPLYTSLVLWLALCCTDPRLSRLWAAPGALLLAARPEGFLMLAGVIPAFALSRPMRRWWLRSTAIVGAAAVLLLGARLFYFHDLVPHPFYVRMRFGVDTGLGRVHGFLLWNFVYVLSVPWIVAFVRSGSYREQRLITAGFVGIGFLWAIVGADYMPFHRHLVPVIPLLYVLIAGGFEQTLGSTRGSLRHATAAASVLLVLATLLASRSVGYFDLPYSNPLRFALVRVATDPLGYASAIAAKLAAPLRAGPIDRIWSGEMSTLGADYQSRIGEMLRASYGEGALVVYDQMGQTPYYAGSKLHFIDALGLTDRRIGYLLFVQEHHGLLGVYAALAMRLPGHALAEIGEVRDPQAASLDLVFDAEPDLVLVNRYVVAWTPSSLPAAILADPRLRRHYAPRATLGDRVLLFERRDREAREIRAPEGLTVEPLTSWPRRRRRE